MRLVEAEVIAAYLNSISVTKPQQKVLVIASRSAALEEAYGLAQPSAKQLATDFPQATSAVIDDFLRRAKTRAEIEIPTQSVSSDLKWRIAPEHSLDRIFNAKSQSLDKAWSSFYREYPRAAGLMRISRVGIDVASNQALFYWSATQGGLSGAGYFVLMHSQQGSWKVRFSKLMWMS